MNEVDKLLHQSRLLWRGSEIKKYREPRESLSTGFAALDKILPENGWPTGAIVDLLLPQHKQGTLHGVGELQLLLPAMCLVAQDKWVLWVCPPYIPYAPALQSAGLDLDRLVLIQDKVDRRNKVWAIEKALQTPGCGMVLCWLDSMSMSNSRRLQLAAEQTGAIAMLLQTKEAKASVAALRLKLYAMQAGLLVEVIKARGASHYHSVELNLYGSRI